MAHGPCTSGAATRTRYTAFTAPNEPWTIGTNVSSGCIRLTNEDIVDLYNRTPIGAKVIVFGTGKPATKMIVGEWYVDELGVPTREITARE